MDKNEFENIAYRAMIGKFEELECEGKYTGNGHHLCQKTCTLLWNEFKQYLGNNND